MAAVLDFTLNKNRRYYRILPIPSFKKEEEEETTCFDSCRLSCLDLALWSADFAYFLLPPNLTFPSMIIFIHWHNVFGAVVGCSFRSVCLQSDETSKRRSNEHSDIKIEEVFLDDVIWEDESSNDSPANVCNSPVNDEEEDSVLSSSTKKGTNNDNVQLANMINILSSIQKNREAKDDFTVFGDVVGRELRKIKSDYAQTVIKSNIITLLFNAQLGKFDNPRSDHSTTFM
ncbi:uncharacterized protein LOC143912564 [Arctopsyche grandis]|uniref:uncharacterized protein LOC143912564 n=1 Tax=Arctopsyche grandis TaxID=121162 RepID=UPI00406DA34E